MNVLMLTVVLLFMPIVAQAGETHTLSLNIPHAGKMRISVLKTERTITRKDTSDIVWAYDIIDAYACTVDGCAVTSAVPAVTLKDYSGPRVPPGTDTSLITNPLRVLDGVSWTGDNSFLPLTIDVTAPLVANFARVIAPQAGQGAPDNSQWAVSFSEKLLEGMGNDAVVATIMPERRLLSWAHNTALVVGVRDSSQVRVWITRTGVPIHADRVTTLLNWDEAKKVAVITVDQRLSPAAVRAMTLDSPYGHTAHGNSANCRYEVDTESGLVRNATCVVEKSAAADRSTVSEEHYVMSEKLLE